MPNEAIARLAILLRSALPSAHTTIASPNSLEVSFVNENSRRSRSAEGSKEDSPSGEPTRTRSISITTRHLHQSQRSPFCSIESSTSVYHPALRKTPKAEIDQLVAAENLGLRGVTVSKANEPFGSLQIRTSFTGVKGRTVDEVESIMIHVLSLTRFARVLEDRIERSVCNGRFCFEIYQTQYIVPSGSRGRFINHAKNLFKGSTGRIFGEVKRVLEDHHESQVKLIGDGAARVTKAGSSTEFTLRIPNEVPIIVAVADLHQFADRSLQGSDAALDFAASLNQLPEMRTTCGHFEVSANGQLISFATWKHLTNDLRLYSVDWLLQNVEDAELMLRKKLTQKPLLMTPNKPENSAQENSAREEGNRFRRSA